MDYSPQGHTESHTTEATEKTYIYIYIYVHIYMYIYIYMCICIYIHIHIYIYTYAHIYIYNMENRNKRPTICCSVPSHDYCVIIVTPLLKYFIFKIFNHMLQISHTPKQTSTHKTSCHVNFQVEDISNLDIYFIFI